MPACRIGALVPYVGGGKSIGGPGTGSVGAGKSIAGPLHRGVGAGRAPVDAMQTIVDLLFVAYSRPHEIGVPQFANAAVVVAIVIAGQ